MIPILGWVGHPPAAENAEHTLEQLTRDAPAPPDRDGRGPRRLLAEALALQGAAATSDGNVFAAITGQPRWRDPELARIARDQSDAVALLHAFRRDGTRLFPHLAGGFALAILEPARRFALLAIDRMGIGALAYACVAGPSLVFASSAEAVRRHPAVAAGIDLQSLYNYSFFHMVPSPATIFAGVRKLEPARFLVWRDGSVEEVRYWEPTFTSIASGSEEELAAELRNRLRDAVVHCRPDDTAGAFLSGGLDSSTVTGMLAGQVDHPVPTYSIGFDQSGYDELKYARITAQHFRAVPREYYVQHHDLEVALLQIAAAYDEPFGNSSAAPTLLCARMARAAGTRMLMAGDGGDEIFGGNERYARQQVFDIYWRLPGSLRNRVVEPLASGFPLLRLPLLSKLRSYIEQARVPMPLRLHSYNFLCRTPPAEVFEADFLARVDTSEPARLLESTWRQAPTESLVDRMLYLDWKFTLADNDLRKVNRMCALEGIQVTYPMLDDDLVELSTRLPPDWKVRNGTLRYFYKRALTGFLPDEVIRKTKHGFGLPFGEWLKKSPSLQASIYAALERLKSRGIVRPAFVDQLIKAHREGQALYFGTMVWVFVMLEHWLSEHGVGDVFAVGRRDAA